MLFIRQNKLPGIFIKLLHIIYTEKQEAYMKSSISYSSLFHILDELYEKIKQDGYAEFYLEALKEAQNSLLVLELLNLSRSFN